VREADENEQAFMRMLVQSQHEMLACDQQKIALRR